MKNTLILGLLALVMLQSCENKDRLNEIKRQLTDNYSATVFNGETKKDGKYTFKEVVRGIAPGKYDKEAKPGWVSLTAPKINKPAPPESESGYSYGDYYPGYYDNYDYYYPDSYDYDYSVPESYDYEDY